jgi:hypothetical protein
MMEQPLKEIVDSLKRSSKRVEFMLHTLAVPQHETLTMFALLCHFRSDVLGVSNPMALKDGVVQQPHEASIGLDVKRLVAETKSATISILDFDDNWLACARPQ